MESDIPPPGSRTPSVQFELDDPSEDLCSVKDIIVSSIDAPVEFVFCDPGVMRFLNLRWRHIDRPTDVLTFDLSSAEDDVPSGVVYIDGRLAPPLSEVLERVFHGWLHLCGMTHDNEKDAQKMNEMTAEMVRNAIEKAGFQ